MPSIQRRKSNNTFVMQHYPDCGQLNHSAMRDNMTSLKLNNKASHSEIWTITITNTQASHV